MMFLFQVLKQKGGSSAFTDVREMVENKTLPQDERHTAAVDLIRRMKRVTDADTYSTGLFALGKFMSDYDIDPNYKNDLRPSLKELAQKPVFETAMPILRIRVESSDLNISEKEQIISTYLMMQSSIEKERKEEQGPIAGEDIIAKPLENIDEGTALFSPSGQTVKDGEFENINVAMMVDRIAKNTIGFNVFGRNKTGLVLQEAILNGTLENILDDRFDGTGGYNLTAVDLGFDINTPKGAAQFSKLTNAAIMRLKSFYDGFISEEKTPGSSLKALKGDKDLYGACKYLLRVAKPDAFTDSEKEMLNRGDVVGFVNSFTNRQDADTGLKGLLAGEAGTVEVTSSRKYKVGVARVLLKDMSYIGKPGDTPAWFVGGAVSLYTSDKSLDFSTTDNLIKYGSLSPGDYLSYSAFSGVFIPSLTSWLEAEIEFSENGVESAGFYAGNRSEQTGELGKKINLGKNWGLEWGAKGNYAFKGSEDVMDISFGNNMEDYLSSIPEQDPGIRRIVLDGIDLDLSPSKTITKSAGSTGDYSMEVQIGTRSPTLDIPFLIKDCFILSTDVAVRVSTQEEPKIKTLFFIAPFSEKLYEYADINLKGGIEKGLNTRGTMGTIGGDIKFKLPDDIAVRLNYQYLWQIEKAMGAMPFGSIQGGEVTFEVPFDAVSKAYKKVKKWF